MQDSQAIINAFNDAAESIRAASEKRYLKLKEVPAYVGISDDTFQSWRKQGLVPISIIGSVKRVDKYDLDALMEQHKVTN